jgi:hypothetical protein
MADKQQPTHVEKGYNGKPDQGASQFGENGRAPMNVQRPAPPPAPPSKKK